MVANYLLVSLFFKNKYKDIPLRIHDVRKTDSPPQRALQPLLSPNKGVSSRFGKVYSNIAFYLVVIRFFSADSVLDLLGNINVEDVFDSNNRSFSLLIFLMSSFLCFD